jgi:Pentapeptide repeats (8 copies)
MKQTRVISWISREVPAAVARQKVWAGIVIVLALLAVVIYLPRLPFVGPRSGRDAESDFRGHLLQALAGLVLAAGAYYTGRTFALNREGQITERFTRAVEQLADEKLDIRLGGIYALERIARDSETHYEPVMEVLTAFLREHARWHPETAALEPVSAGEEPRDSQQAPETPELRVDFQATATVLERRDRSHERPHYVLDLRGVDLHGAWLPDAHLEEVNLSGANLSRAYLLEADLRATNLTGTNLSRAYLLRANLSAADLSAADLSWADLAGATFFVTKLIAANLFRADLTGAKLGGDLFAARLFEARLSGADLSGAVRLTNEQLAGAITDEETKLPEYLAREGGG